MNHLTTSEQIRKIFSELNDAKLVINPEPTFPFLVVVYLTWKPVGARDTRIIQEIVDNSDRSSFDTILERMLEKAQEFDRQEGEQK